MHTISSGKCSSFAAVSGSDQHDRVAQVSVENQGLIGDILNATLEGIEFEESTDKLGQSENVLLLVAQ